MCVFVYHLGIYNEDFTFFSYIGRVWVFDYIYLYRLGSYVYIKQELLYLGQFDPISIQFRMVLTQIKTRVYKDSLIVMYPSNMNI